MVAWREMSQFADVDLEDSRVLGWSFDVATARLTFHLDARILPGHGAYAPSLGVTDAEGPVDYSRPAQLIFDRVRRVEGLVPSFQQWLAHQPDPSRVDTFAYLRAQGDTYHFDSLWGAVEVDCELVRFVVADSPDSPAAAA